MLIVRIKQAEHALAAGRLEEACDLLRAADMRSHRRGLELIGQLVDGLKRRGQLHLAAGRFPQAQMDADRALAFGGNLTDVAELRAAIATAVETTQRHERKKAHVLAAARQQIDRGRLALGEKWLADLSTTESRAAVLLRDVDVKRSILQSAIENATAAIERGDLATAVREILTARSADAGDSQVAELSSSIADQIKTQLNQAINSGRLDLADILAGQLAAVCGETADVLQYRRGIEECRAAWAHMDAGQPARATEILRRILMIFPSASWVGQTLSHLKQADEALAELRGGPLALLALSGASPGVAGVQPAPAERKTTPPPLPAGALPSRFVLRVDGAGSFVVFRQPIVTIGPVSSSQQPDLGLMAEPGVPIATIERREDEYFIRGAAVAVNDRPGTGKLLATGDRIALSPRCRLCFALPSAASTTAVLDLTGGRFPRGDVRRVILLDRDIVLGAGLATHARVEHAEENVILHVRDGRLFCEAKSPIEINGSPMDRLLGIPMEAHVKAGNVSFVVSSI